MPAKKKDKGTENRCTDFMGDQGDFQKMFDMMKKCCTGQEGMPDCSAMMKGMMEVMKKDSKRKN